MNKFKYFIFGVLSGSVILFGYYLFALQNQYISKDDLLDILNNKKGGSLVNTNGSSNGSVITNELRIDRENAITNAVSSVSPAVVGINVMKLKQQAIRSPFASDPFFKDFFPNKYRNKKVKSSGSGFVVSEDGYIVTNEHVIHNAMEIVVTNTQGEIFNAKIIGTDEKSDLAVLKIDTENHPIVKFGKSDKILIGEWVIAFGNPYGLFEYIDKPLITVGVISGVGINFGTTRNERHFYGSMIQTDASINPGNSGGPLVNSSGEVIGLNTMVFSETGGSLGIGFAIPSKDVIELKDLLIKNGYINRNIYFGFTELKNIDEVTAQKYNTDLKDGVFVIGLADNSPVDKAGFVKGDLIVAVENIKINNYNDIHRAIFDAKDYKVGDKISFIVYRGKKFETITMKLAPLEISGR